MLGLIGIRDAFRIGLSALRTRRVRAAMSALGVAIGIASLVAVLGLSESSRSDLVAQLDRLGTNLLRVEPGQSFFGDEAVLPLRAPGMIRRAGPVQTVAAVEALDGSVRRSDRIPREETGGISVQAADRSLLRAVRGTVAQGHWLTRASARLPTVVLGSVAAQRLG